MSKLLTIAIPTYNRAQLLDQQLSRLSQVLKGFESECEILVSDNCSSDNTQEIIKKWQGVFQDVPLRANKNPQNLGVMRNIEYCLKNANTKYVWTIGDDDPIKDGAIDYVIKQFQDEPDLSLLIMNFCVRFVGSEEILYDRTFEIENDEFQSDGKAVIEKYLTTDHRGLGFLTAQIYRTEAAQRALEKWPDSVKNYEGQIFWSAYCATEGKIKISKEIYVENAHIHYKPKTWFQMHYLDLPEVFAKLMEVGYSEDIFRKRIIKHIVRKNNIKIFLGGLRRWPILTMNMITQNTLLLSKLAFHQPTRN
jgi:glycosyltransferase involved in cell wall biosynthesis